VVSVEGETPVSLLREIREDLREVVSLLKSMADVLDRQEDRGCRHRG